MTREPQPVAGYAGRYTVAASGEVFSHVTGEPVACPTIADARGLCVALTDRHGKTAFHRVARLVAAAFLPPPADGERIGYRDGNALNCAADNLQWTEPGLLPVTTTGQGEQSKEATTKTDGRRRAVVRIDDNGERVVFPSVLEASRAVKVRVDQIRIAANGKAKRGYAAGYRWQWVDKT